MKTEIKRCDHCGQKIKPEWREIILYKGMVIALDIVYQWCKEKQRHEFRMGEIKHLISQIEYTRFNDWPKFAGIVYRPGGDRTHYGINMERAYMFLSDQLMVPEKVWKSRKGNGIRPEGNVRASQIKGVAGYLDERGLYKAAYRDEPPVTGKLL